MYFCFEVENVKNFSCYVFTNNSHIAVMNVQHMFDQLKSPHHRKLNRKMMICIFWGSEQEKLISLIHPASLTFDLWVIDLPLAAACRPAEEMLPAESGLSCPNVGCDL